MAELDLPLVQKPDTIRDLGEVNVAPLLSIIGKLSETVWDVEDEGKENDFWCFHHTKHMILKFIHGNQDPRDHYNGQGWAFWGPQVEPIMRELASRYGYKNPVFPKAMFAKLKAHNFIDMHRDSGGSNPYVHKIHLPLFTNEKADFLVEEHREHLKVGRAYEVNNLKRHGVVNKGDTDRVHFIFEVFENAAESTTKEDVLA